ncbi:MAG: hypothetical protein WC829_07765 [Hyphomicrobium sp.]|jgi:hypothetical protein
MKGTIATVLALALAASISGAAFAAGSDEGSLSDKVMQDAPGTMGGHTANPTAVPQSGSATQKAMNDLPGTKGGNTSNPTGKPKSGALSQKAMEDHPGTR